MVLSGLVLSGENVLPLALITTTQSTTNFSNKRQQPGDPRASLFLISDWAVNQFNFFELFFVISKSAEVLMMCTPGARSRHLAPEFPGAL